MREIPPENENNDDDQEGDKNERCDKTNFKIDEARGDEILWVHCMKCFKLFHKIYIPLTNMLEENLEDYNFTCDSCILE